MEKQSMLLEDLLAGEAHICWHARSAVIFQGCRLHRLKQGTMYVSWHARSVVIFHTCQLDHFEWEQICWLVFQEHGNISRLSAGPLGAGPHICQLAHYK